MLQKPRIAYIDIARGFVILLVILGHLVPYEGTIWSLIFAFHMPFFFLLSGYCTGEKTLTRRLDKFLAHTTVTLLIPEVFIRLFLWVSLDNLTTPFWDYFLHPTTEWFVSSLFAVRILLYLFALVERKLRSPARRLCFGAFVIAVCFFAATWALENGYHHKPAWFPIPVDTTLIGLSFAIIGHFLRKIDFDAASQGITKWELIPMTLATLCAIDLVDYNTFTNVASGYLGYSDLFYVVIAVWFSVLTLLGAAWFARKAERAHLNLFSCYFRFLGCNSLFFYIAHAVLFHYLNRVILAQFGITLQPMIDFGWGWVALYFALSLVLLSPLAFVKERLADFTATHTKQKAAFSAVCCTLMILITCLLAAFR